MPTILDFLAFDAAGRKELADLLVKHVAAFDAIYVDLALDASPATLARIARDLADFTRRAIARASTPQPRSTVGI